MDNKQLAVFLAFTGLVVVALAYSFFLGKNLSGSKTSVDPGRSSEHIPLSEFQITACGAADKSGACQTRLPRLKLVLAQECCRHLGKCC